VERQHGPRIRHRHVPGNADHRLKLLPDSRIYPRVSHHHRVPLQRNEVKIAEVRKRAFAMPLTNPSYPPAPYRFYDREYVIITYRTDAAALEAVVPEPLEIVEPVVKYEFIRMPDSTGFGDYTESGQVIPVRFKASRACTFIRCILTPANRGQSQQGGAGRRPMQMRRERLDHGLSFVRRRPCYTAQVFNIRRQMLKERHVRRTGRRLASLDHARIFARVRCRRYCHFGRSWRGELFARTALHIGAAARPAQQ
jgi:hypothetical protein